jgi:predicted nucleic acid-binding protein
MILVDTSVLIDYLRTRDAKLLGLMQRHGARFAASSGRKSFAARRTQDIADDFLRH